MLTRGILCAWLAILASIYVYALYCIRTPHVDDVYRRFYIRQELRYWPGESGLSYRTGTKLSFNAPVKYESRIGWSASEDWGTWTEGTEASLDFALVGSFRNLLLSAQLDPFLTNRHPTLDVDVLANGIPVAEWMFSSAGSTQDRTALIPRSAIGGDRLLKVTFRISKPSSPASAGINGDRRELGLGFHAVTLDSVQ